MKLDRDQIHALMQGMFDNKEDREWLQREMEAAHRNVEQLCSRVLGRDELLEAAPPAHEVPT